MLPHWLENPKVRIIGAGVLMMALIAVAAYIVRMEPTNEDRVRDTILRSISAFESKDMERFLGQLAPTPNIDGGTYGHFRTRDEVEDAARRAFDNLTYLNIRPRQFNMIFDPPQERAWVTMDFHWTASGGMYPNARSRSESRNEGGLPDVATFGLYLDGDKWLIQDVVWQQGGGG